MIKIEKISLKDLQRIIELAEKTWEPTYKEILSKEQLIYMFEMMYSEAVLRKRMLNVNDFYISKINQIDVGFLETVKNDEYKLYISKIYVDPNYQKKGIGKYLIEFLEKKAISMKFKSLKLNVNRYNPAQHFYTRIGFRIEKQIDIEIGNGYLMEDYIMEKELLENK